MTQATHSFPEDEGRNYFESQLAGEINGTGYEPQSMSGSEPPASLMTPEVVRSFATPEPRRSWRDTRKVERQISLAHAKDEGSASLAAHAQKNYTKLDVIGENLKQLSPGAAKGIDAAKTAYIVSAIDRIMSV